MADPQDPQQTQSDLKIVSAQPLPDDLKIVQAHVDQGKDVPHPVVARLLDWLPAAGGIAGAMIGGGSTLETGPGAIAGAAAGATFGGVAGESARQNINRLVGNPAPASMGEAATNMAVAGGLQGAGELVAGGIPAVAGKVAPWLMTKAAKPSAKLLEDFRTSAPKLAQTLLDEGVNVTRGGVAKLDALVSATRDQLKSLLADSAAQIPKSEIIAPVANVAMKVANQTDPMSDLAAIGKHVEGFANHPKFSGPTMTAQETQALKVGNYEKLRGSYGERGSAIEETDKAVARGAKEAIESRIASARALNQRDADLTVAREAVAKQVGLAANRDPGGLAWIAKNPQTMLTYVLEKSPAVKSMLARGLYKSVAAASGVPETLVRLAVHSLAGLPEEMELDK